MSDPWFPAVAQPMTYEEMIDEAIRRAGGEELTIGAIGPRVCRRCGRVGNVGREHDGGYIRGCNETGSFWRCRKCCDELCVGRVG